jgi:AAA+ ATPase superfamily predicted ATPase
MNQRMEEKFFGRKIFEELLKRRVLDFKDGYRQNMAFLGARSLGKTFLLQNFLSGLDDQEFIPIYLDLENKDFDYFAQRILGSLLYQFAKMKNLPLQEDLSLLLEGAQSFIPHTAKTIKKIRSLIEHGKKADAFHELIALPQNFSREANAFCVVILDEFDHLEEVTIPGAFQELGKKVMTQKRCLYVVASSTPHVAKKILSEKLSLLFGHFEILNVEPFDLKTSQEYVAFHLQELQIKDLLRNFVIDFTGGHPLYLNLVCQELRTLSQLHQQNEVYLPMLSQALVQTLCHRWGALGRHFESTIKHLCNGKGNLVLARLFLSLAKGKQKLRELSHALNLRQSLTTQKLHRLIEIGLVAKNGNYYYLPDKMFRYWLRFVFLKSFSAIPRAESLEQTEFYPELTRAFEDYANNAQKDLSTRIIDLFYCFENESFLINGRRYRLPTVREAVTRAMATDNPEHLQLIRALTSAGEWFIILKPEKICENDIHAAIGEYKKMVQKPQQCVLISLSELDENARVRALQERMWIWSEGELNTLLQLYDKPYIMR